MTFQSLMLNRMLSLVVINASFDGNFAIVDNHFMNFARLDLGFFAGLQVPLTSIC